MAPRRIRTLITARSAARGVVHLVLQDPDHWPLPPFQPGAHIDLYLPNGMTRTYSLLNDPAFGDRYEIAVKREADGRGGSRLLYDHLRVGDEIGVGLPRGGVPLGPAPQIFIAGGIGVTPFLSACAALRRAGRRDFHLHLMARGAPPLGAALDGLIAAGLATLHDTTRAPRPHMAALLATHGGDAACCGPEPMLDAFADATSNWASSRVHMERFRAPPPDMPPNARAYALVLARSAREIQVPAGASMLEALTESGIDVPHSCCGGVCGLCRVTWTEGEPIHRDRALKPAERTHTLLACVTLSAGPRLVVDL